MSSKPSGGSRWREIWVVDFEFCHDPDGRPDVICLAARELRSGQTVALWRDQLSDEPPYDISEDALFVCYSGMEAELACHLALGWPLPANVVDLIVEYRMAINGLAGRHKLGLLDALARWDIPLRTSPEEKKRAQQRAIWGWPFAPEDQEWLLRYCKTDVAEECDLLLKLGGQPLSPGAVWRGKFIKALARMWWRGVPIDPHYAPLATDHLARLALRERIIADIRFDVPVYDGLTLKQAELEAWLDDHGIPAPRTPTGRVSIALDNLARLALDYPALGPFAEAQHTLGQLREFSLPVGADNRLRAWFAPFLTKTSRAAPPTNGYIYSLPAWIRSTMLPEPGLALAYLDWQAMEFGLAGALSGDANMMAFYRSGDPYLATAVAAGAVPANATKDSHPVERGLYKTASLACLYGIAANSLAQRLKLPVVFAWEFLRIHRRLFAGYWNWSDGVVAEAIRKGGYTSRHGWRYAVQPPFNERSLRNWPIQTAGADILRCAVIFADSLGIEMLATAHDAVLIQAPEDRIEQIACEMEYCMRRAASLLTGGIELGVDVEIKRCGERFVDPRGKRTFALVEKFMSEWVANAD
jgi:DNA polymerase-1